MNYCIPSASQDLENAKRTAVTMIYSGIWNPTVDSTYAHKGTLFIGIGSDPAVAGKMWQKQDDGCSTNWTEVASSSSALDSLTLGKICSLSDNSGLVKDAIAYAKGATATVVVNTVGAGDLAAAVAAAVAGDVIEVQTNATYSPVVIPAGVRFVLRAGAGFTPKITGDRCIRLSDGAANVTVIGFGIENATTPNANFEGSGICMLGEGSKVSDIIFSNMSFLNCAGSAILIAGKQAAYASNYTLADLSDGFAVVDSSFMNACSDITKGASVFVRGCRNVLFRHCYVDNGAGRSRGFMLQACIESVIEDCVALSSLGLPLADEGYKLDILTPATAPFKNDVVVRRCRAQGFVQGFDADDQTVAQFEDCFSVRCTDGFVSLKATNKVTFLRDVAVTCTNGFRVVNASIESCLKNLAANCTNGYVFPVGYLLDDTNQSGARDSMLLALYQDPLPSFAGQWSRYVDAAIGNDVTGDGSILKPFKTITVALASITDESAVKRYCIHLAAGEYIESFNMREYISLIGQGQDNTLITGTMTFNGAAGATGRNNFANFGIDTALVYVSAAFNNNVRFTGCRIGLLEYEGGAGYGGANVNNLFLHGCHITNFDHYDGAAWIYDGLIAGYLKLYFNPALPGEMTFAEAFGTTIQGPITMRDGSMMFIRGSIVTGSITGTTTGALKPIYDTDRGSRPYGAIGGVIVINDAGVINVNADYVAVGYEDLILVDASGGPVNVTLVPAANFVGGQVIVKKTDMSLNAVNILNNIDGAPYTLAAGNQKVRAMSDGAAYFEV